MLNKLPEIREKLISQRDALTRKIRELDSEKEILQSQLAGEFDQEVAAEIAGQAFDGGKIKKLNAELIEIDGRAAAYNRQLKSLKLSDEDRTEILEEAAAEYRMISTENIKRLIYRYEIDEQIRELLTKGRTSVRVDDSNLFEQLMNSGLFTDTTSDKIKYEVIRVSKLDADAEYLKLSSKLDKLQNGSPRYRIFIWDQIQ